MAGQLPMESLAPLASGVLTGKYDDGIPKGSRLDQIEWLQKSRTDEAVEKVKSRPNPDLELLGVVITLHDKRTVLGRDIKKQIAKVFGDKVFDTVISKNVRLEESPAYRESIFSYAPDSSGALDYYKLSEEVVKRV